MDYSSLHLDPDEHVILEVRKHWIVFAGRAASVALAAALPFMLWIIFRIFFPDFLSAMTVPAHMPLLIMFFYSLWLLFLWISFFVAWTTYYLDVWYVTEKRIIAIDQRRIFDREISNLRFDKIQDVTIDVYGFIPTLLNFGDVKVQTASEDNVDFVLKTVRQPDLVRQVIFNQHNEIGDVAFGKPRL